MSAVGKRTRCGHLRVVEAYSPMAFSPVRAPDPHRPPPMSAVARREMAEGMRAVLFLEAVEAGSDKARELDGELLDCCAEARRADRTADTLMDCLDIMAADDAAFLPALEAAQPLFGAYLDAVDRAAQLPARTPEGLREKATLLLLHIGTGQDHTMLAASLARDVAGRA